MCVIGICSLYFVYCEVAHLKNQWKKSSLLIFQIFIHNPISFKQKAFSYAYFVFMPNISSGLFRGTRTVGLLTLLSRLLGFVRDLLFARLFGAGAASDAFFVAFRIPNLLRSIFAEGAFTSAFVPSFTRALDDGHAKGVVAIRQLSSLLMFGSALTSALGIFFAPEIIRLVAPGFHPEDSRYDLCVQLTQIMMPYIFFVSLVSLVSGALSAVHIYGASAWAQVVMNAVSILAAALCFFLPPEDRAYALAWATLLGGVLQLFVQFPALRRAHLSILPNLALFGSHSRDVMKLMLPAIFGASLYQLTMLLNTLFASTLEEGSVSWLFYADRLAQFPMGVFTIALGTVLLPALSRSLHQSHAEDFSRQIFDSLRYTSFFILPCAAGLYALAPILIPLLFERGAFDARASTETAHALQAYSLGLWGGSCYAITARSFLAAKDTVTPTLLSLSTLLLTFFLSLLLMGPLRVDASSGFILTSLASLQHVLSQIFPMFTFGHRGLALSASLAATFTCLLLFVLTQRRFTLTGWMGFLCSSLRSLLASLVMAAGLLFLVNLQLSLLLCLTLALPLGIFVYFFLHFLFKSPEYQETLKALGR